MSNFLTETFSTNGAYIQSTGWTKLTGYTGDINQLNGRAISYSPGDPSAYRHSTAAAPSADYIVAADYLFFTAIPNISYGICGRCSTSAATFYVLYYDSAAGWTLAKRIANTQTGLGTFAQTLSASTTYRAELVMNGTQISAKVDGTTIIGPVTDSSITAAGYPGIRLANWTGSAETASTGVHLDNLTADTIETAAVTHSTSGALSATAATVTGSSSLTSATTTHEASGALTAGSATLSGSATYVAIHAASGTLQAGIATVSGTASRSSAGTATFSTPALKNNTGTVLASLSGWTVNVYNVSTGALIVQKTGLSTDASGVLTITDAALTASATYSYEPVHATYGRRLPTATAA